MSEPNTGENVVWQHSGYGVIASQPLKRLTENQIKHRRTFNWVFNGVSYIVLLGIIFTDVFGFNDIKEFLFSGYGLVLLLIVFVVSFVLRPLFQKVYFEKIFPQQDTNGVPLWMSSDRIMCNTATKLDDFEVVVREIKSATLDYAVGSQAVVLRLQQKTVNLISSEANTLLKHLYILRPDLEPAS